MLTVLKSNSPRVFLSSRALSVAGTTSAGEPSTGFSEQIAMIMKRFLHRILRILAPSQFGEGRGGALESNSPSGSRTNNQIDWDLIGDNF